MRVIDCFTFFNELELLELRLATLDSKVDHFVLVESTTTFTGKRKPLFYLENKDRFAKYTHKIKHYIYPGIENISNPWLNESNQRNYGWLAKDDLALEDTDLFIISDIDEIPKLTDTITTLTAPKVFKQILSYYHVNYRQTERWRGSIIAPSSTIKTLQNLRNVYSMRPVYPDTVFDETNSIEDGGWHFSYLGSADRLKYKIESYSELNNALHKNSRILDPAFIQKCLDDGSDLFNRADPRFQKTYVPIDDSFPSTMRTWLDKYPQYIKMCT